MGRKRGMTQVFDDKGRVIACTVIHAEPNVIAQIKIKEVDGYLAVQTSFETITTKDPRTMDRRITKPLMGHFKKAKVPPKRFLTETRVDAIEEYSVGQEFTVAQFEEGQLIDVQAISKGKGYQGLMKKNNFKGGPGAHGSGFHRHAGSTGMRSTPGLCFKGSPRPGQMGAKAVTTQNVTIVKIEKDKNLILVRGSIPGYNGCKVCLWEAKKKIKS